MPCRYDGPDNSRDLLREELDAVTQHLCDVLSQLDQEGNIDHYVNINLEKWWAKHKVADAKRRKAEAAKAQEEKRRKAALKKLTPEERKLLGL